MGQRDLPAEALGTEVHYGWAANRRAVTRVNLEQASKVQMWKPTRPIFGEGRSGTGKKPIYAPVPVHRGNEDGMSGKRFMQRGRPVPEVG